MTVASPPATAALEALLRSMADDEFVIGFSDSEWTGIAPLLEEDVAMSSLAQDELGHAAALYGLLADLTGGDADALAYDREPDEYRHARLLDHGRGDWAMTIARRYLYETADAVRLEALAEGRWAPLAELVGKLVREERYHRMHIDAWLDRLARAAGEPRDRLLDAFEVLAPDAATVFTPLPGEPALVEAGVLAAPMATLAERWRTAIAPTLRGLDLPVPTAPIPTGRPGRPRRAVPLAVGRVHQRPPERPGSDLVSEGPTHVGIARTRAGLIRRATRRSTEAAVRSALAEVMDPELPMVSIVDLGMVGRVDVDVDGIEVDLLPTFIGCPALELIRSAVEQRLGAFDRPVRVVSTLLAAVERRPDHGRRARRPSRRPGSRRRRPRATCGARCATRTRVTMDNAFGPTQCRSLYYCRDCRQPFEAIKPI